jgi:hypothetical protein
MDLMHAGKKLGRALGVSAAALMLPVSIIGDLEVR